MGFSTSRLNAGEHWSYNQHLENQYKLLEGDQGKKLLCRITKLLQVLPPPLLPPICPATSVTLFFFFSTTTKQKIISSEASFLGEEHTTTFQNVYSCLDFSVQASSCPYSKAIFSFPCQRLLWPELALWACFINVTLTFTAQPHWHPDFALPIPSDARKPSGYAQTIYFGDMHWLWHSDRNEPQGREMTTSDPEKDELGLCQSSFSTEIRAGTAFPCHQAL